MPDSVNERIADEIRAHAVDFERFSAAEVAAVLAILTDLEKDLLTQIRDIDPTEPLRKTYRDARLAKLLEQTRVMIRDAYSVINKQTAADLAEVAELTTTATVTAVNTVVGVEIMTVAVPPEKWKALVSNAMIEGAPTKDWWSKQAGDTVFRFTRAVQQGYAQGETVDQIVRRVRGTRERNYKDGILDVTKRNATTLVHTSVAAVSNAARRDAFSENDDIISHKMQISSMDNRTTILCMSYSNRIWDMNDKPVGHNLPWNGGPPRHPRCRSTIVPILKGIDEIEDGRLKNLPESTQASMDGQVPADWSYEDFLRRKPEKFQKEMLGVGKWQLWKDGRITFANLVDQRGNELTLAELRAKYGD